jgi:hypothetical protein
LLGSRDATAYTIISISNHTGGAHRTQALKGRRAETARPDDLGPGRRKCLLPEGADYATMFGRPD